MGRACGYPKSSGGSCKRSAGWGTSHRGSGLCKQHEALRDQAADRDELSVKIPTPADVHSVEEDLQIARRLRDKVVDLVVDDIDAVQEWARETGRPVPKMLRDPGSAAQILNTIASLIRAAGQYRASRSLTKSEVEEAFQLFAQETISACRERAGKYMQPEKVDEFIGDLSRALATRWERVALGT